MSWACEKGELNVCKWLHGNGAADDISKVNNEDTTPMFIACQEGHLSVCKWLFEVGAAGDITKATDGGKTPMRAAIDEKRTSVLQWLVLKGALTSDAADGHTDKAIIRSAFPETNQRTALLNLAMEQVAANDKFQRTFLVGTLSPQRSAHLWKLGSLDDATNKYLKQLVADFLGMPCERELRNAREAAIMVRLFVRRR